MLTEKDILDLYKKYGVSASKRFGQNFLHNQKIIEKIINSTDTTDQHVIEIGPGLGSLTLALLEKSKKVSSYEIDKDMVRVLKGEIQKDNFELIEGDFLKADLNWEGKRPVIANIPYNITSDILFKLFNNSSKFSEAILMMQKEVGERLLAPVGSKNYGKLTITTQYFAEVEKVTIVPPSSFVPSPKVTSIVVKLKFKDVKFDKELIEFFKKCFAQRRKTLFNNLRNFIEPSLAKNIISKLELKESVRPQELTLEQFIEIYNQIKKNC